MKGITHWANHYETTLMHAGINLTPDDDNIETIMSTRSFKISRTNGMMGTKEYASILTGFYGTRYKNAPKDFSHLRLSVQEVSFCDMAIVSAILNDAPVEVNKSGDTHDLYLKSYTTFLAINTALLNRKDVKVPFGIYVA